MTSISKTTGDEDNIVKNMYVIPVDDCPISTIKGITLIFNTPQKQVT